MPHLPFTHLLIKEPLQSPILLLQGQPASTQEQELILIGVVPDLYLLHVPVCAPLGIVVAELDLVDDAQVRSLDNEGVGLGVQIGGFGWGPLPASTCSSPIRLVPFIPLNCWAEQTFQAGALQAQIPRTESLIFHGLAFTIALFCSLAPLGIRGHSGHAELCRVLA